MSSRVENVGAKIERFNWIDFCFSPLVFALKLQHQTQNQLQNILVNVLNFSGRLPLCDPYMYASCGAPSVKRYMSTKASLKCDCPLECHRPSYPYSISTSPLSQHYLNYTSKLLNFKGKNISVSKLNREIAFVDIFYSSLVFTSVRTIPAYSGLGLFCDIGGTLGLVLGASVLSVFEIFQLISKILADLFKAK